MKKSVIVSIGLATALFTGCGSSDGGSTTGKGYYIDSAVSGVDYVCGTESGKTGPDGSFTFEKGKSCTFSLGSMKLRVVEAITLKDQVKVLEDNLAVATLLQTLDSDGDPDNDGITISAKMVEAFKTQNITVLPANQDAVAVIYEAIKNVEGYQGELKSETDAQTHLAKAQGSQLKELLGGKTFYNVSAADDYLDKLSFNADVTSLTWITLKGGNIGETETETTNIRDFTLKEQTKDYILIHNSDGGGTSRLYFDKAKAEAYWESLGSSADSGSSGDSAGEDPANSNPNTITQAILDGKTFYDEEATEDGSMNYGKMIFTAGTLTRDSIKVGSNNSFISDNTSTLNYTIVDGKIRIAVNNMYKWFTRTPHNGSEWHMLNDDDEGKDGILDRTNEQVSWSLSKPAHFPAEL